MRRPMRVWQCAVLLAGLVAGTAAFAAGADPVAERMLQAQTASLSPVLSLAQAMTPPMERIALNEQQFRFALNEDAMATEKLAEGIRLFARDQEKLEKLLTAQA